ncbi:superinfection immunity protein [Candidatus Absconditicoccus praedator]|uniref:superinfection immunity protein n=1 Tax=Candidatus Absconditicoccus praedator TaxID=2735562 RepID=UPI001E577D5B|nr:superinfection immunity protein [Candidatus Absconditicoccus praedator]UFX82896.1 superinfection immunity protein [Candidatus Absconditicoccus praedator]
MQATAVEPGLSGFVTIFSVFTLYMLPTIIALIKGKKILLHIIVVNIFTGWTFVGWIIAITMCFLDDRRYFFDNNLNNLDENSNKQ